MKMNRVETRILALVALLLILCWCSAFSQTSALNVKNGSNQSLFFITETGRARIGIGIDTSASLTLFGNDGFVAKGLFGTGTSYSLGAGTRLQWYPKKGAFRAGSVDGTEWDDANTGSYSTAMGSGTIASGSYSTALGVSTTASGYNATALGFRSIASGSVTTALGYYTTASGDYSAVIGQGVDGSNRLIKNINSSLMIGYNSTIPTLFIGPSSGAGMFGKVGIGTKNPTTALQVAGTIYSSVGGFKFPDGSVQTSAGVAGQWTVSTNDIFSANSGNVGIGDATPTYKLDIAGKIGVRDTQVVYLPDQTALRGSLFIGTGGNSLQSDGWQDERPHGGFNTAVGIGALYADKMGYRNTAIGYQALHSNLGGGGWDSGELAEDGVQNTAIGYQALFSNISGSGNTATGVQSLYSFNGGLAAYNTANGYQALYSNILGRRNTAIGYKALYYHGREDDNTAAGYMAGYLDGYSGTSGTGNTYIGAYAGKNVDGGSNNTIIGFQAGEGYDSPAPTFSGNVFIGAYAGRFNRYESNRLIIDNQWEGEPLIYGEFDNRKLKVNGRFQATDTIYASAGGFKFPDGTVQATASTGGGKWLGGTDIYYNSGNVGVGTATPLTKLHVTAQAIALPIGALVNDAISVESGDAGLGLYSSNGGNYGSAFSMGEVVSGALTNKWSLYRTTSTANPANQLRISYGSNANYALNPSVMSLSANGRVGIGTTNPAHTLDVEGMVYAQTLEVSGMINCTHTGVMFPDGTLQKTAALPKEVVVAIDSLTDARADTSSIFLGRSAGLNDNGHTYNTTVGIEALYANTGGEHNVANGFQTLYSNTVGGNNTANGYQALLWNQFGSYNSVMGAEALFFNVYGSHNIAAGYRALYHNVGGGQSIDGSYNIGIGTETLFNNQGASHNIAAGYQALYSNAGTLSHELQEGDHNIALGYQSLFHTDPGGLSPATISTHNIGAGYQALYNNTTGNGNIAIGYQSGKKSATGDYNTFVGYGADASAGTLDNATAIGYNAVVNASNKVRIGNTSVTVIEGQVDFTYTSDRNKKENFLDIDGEEILRKLRNLKLQSWSYRHDQQRTRHYGPVAQEFFGAFGNDGRGVVGSDTTLCGSDVNGINMIAIQALERRTLDLQKENTRLQKRNVELQERLEALESAVKLLSASHVVVMKSN